MHRDHISGFTLIELMVVVGIVVIITMFAMASYRNVTTDVQISHGAQELTRIAGELEILRTKGFAYNSQKATEKLDEESNKTITYSKSAIYVVTFERDSTEYELTATATADYEDRFGECDKLTLNWLGEREPKQCWE